MTTKTFNVRVGLYDGSHVNETWTINQRFSVGDVLTIKNGSDTAQFAPVYMKEVVKALEEGWRIYVEEYYGLGDVETVENADIPVRGDKWVFEGFDASISDVSRQ